MESMYIFAGEVGGYLLRVIPVKSVGVLAIIGDASRKGMPAAMTVSFAKTPNCV